MNDIRKLYLRELAARFGHHLAIVWNLGEENNTPANERREVAGYIRAMNPNGHAITVASAQPAEVAVLYEGFR